MKTWKVMQLPSPIRTVMPPPPRPAARPAGRTAAVLAAALLGWSCLLPAARAASSPWASNPQSQVRLISAWRIAPRQGELRLGLHFRLARGWHVYWKNSGDAGYAPVVAFTRQAGLAYPQLLWPAPHRYELPGGLEAFGYDTEVIYPIHAVLSGGSGSSGGAGSSGGPGGGESSGSARGGGGGRGAATAAGGTLRLGADVDYLVCEIDCVPHRYSLELDQPVGDAGAADPETAPLLDRWWQQLPAAAGQLSGVRIAGAIAPLPPDGSGRTAAEAGDLRLTLELQGVTAAPGGADLFFETDPALGLGRPRVRASAAGLVFEVPVRRLDRSAPLPAAAVLAWTATGLERGGAPLSLAGRLEAPIRTPTAESTMAGRGATGTSSNGAAVPAATAAPAGPSAGPATPIAPAGTLAAILAAGDPRLVVLLAAAAALAALDLWGLLRRRPAAARAIRREALGFLALLLVLALLYTLSLEVRPESLAAVELALLGMGLASWLWRRYRRQRPPAGEPAGPRPAPS